VARLSIRRSSSRRRTGACTLSRAQGTILGIANAGLVHYVAAGSGASVDKEKLLSAHRDVDADCHTGARSLPDMTLAMTRYVACVKGGVVLGFARLVYVHWLFSSLARVL
jgi:hypothetical protein